jgi:hypothetical protein
MYRAGEEGVRLLSHQPHVCDPQLAVNLLAGFFFTCLSAAGLRTTLRAFTNITNITNNYRF